MGNASDNSAPQRTLLDGIIVRAREDIRRNKTETSARLEAARAEAQRLACELATLPGISKILHFGSSATGRNFGLDSDIDIAITGGDILEAMRVAESSVFNVDVIDVDTVPSPLKEAILEEGVVLYEKR